MGKNASLHGLNIYSTGKMSTFSMCKMNKLMSVNKHKNILITCSKHFLCWHHPWWHLLACSPTQTLPSILIRFIFGNRGVLKKINIAVEHSLALSPSLSLSFFVLVRTFSFHPEMPGPIRERPFKRANSWMEFISSDITLMVVSLLPLIFFLCVFVSRKHTVTTYGWVLWSGPDEMNFGFYSCFAWHCKIMNLPRRNLQSVCASISAETVAEKVILMYERPFYFIVSVMVFGGCPSFMHIMMAFIHSEYSVYM